MFYGLVRLHGKIKFSAQYTEAAGNNFLNVHFNGLQGVDHCFACGYPAAAVPLLHGKAGALKLYKIHCISALIILRCGMLNKVVVAGRHIAEAHKTVGVGHSLSRSSKALQHIETIGIFYNVDGAGLCILSFIVYRIQIKHRTGKRGIILIYFAEAQPAGASPVADFQVDACSLLGLVCGISIDVTVLHGGIGHVVIAVTVAAVFLRIAPVPDFRFKETVFYKISANIQGYVPGKGVAPCGIFELHIEVCGHMLVIVIKLQGDGSVFSVCPYLLHRQGHDSGVVIDLQLHSVVYLGKNPVLALIGICCCCRFYAVLIQNDGNISWVVIAIWNTLFKDKGPGSQMEESLSAGIGGDCVAHGRFGHSCRAVHGVMAAAQIIKDKAAVVVVHFFNGKAHIRHEGMGQSVNLYQ